MSRNQTGSPIGGIPESGNSGAGSHSALRMLVRSMAKDAAAAYMAKEMRSTAAVSDQQPQTKS